LWKAAWAVEGMILAVGLGRRGKGVARGEGSIHFGFGDASLGAGFFSGGETGTEDRFGAAACGCPGRFWRRVEHGEDLKNCEISSELGGGSTIPSRPLQPPSF
jgi:hypothetical protein